LLDLTQYFGIRGGGRRNITFFSSRGCPFGCAFYSTAKIYGKKFRTHSHDFVIQNLTHLKSTYGVNSIFFCDDNFYLNKSRGQKIISEMNRMGISCDCLDVRLDQLQDDDLQFFEKNKVKGVFFGWESGSDRILSMLGKRINVESIISKCELISKYNIPCTGSGMMLVPTEDIEETISTINLANRLRRMLKNSSIVVMRFMPLPGTPTSELCSNVKAYTAPTRPQEWINIDPREPSYRATWIPWLDQRLNEKLRITQELSISGIADYIEGTGPFNAVRQLIARSLNYRMSRRKYFLLFEPILYEFGVNLRSKLARSK
jgi:hypothetical protein